MPDRISKWRLYLAQHPKAVNDARLLLDDPDSAEGPGWWDKTTPLNELVTAAIPPGDPERIPLIRLLLEQGADPNARDAFGRTALYYACLTDTRDAEIVKLLLQFGADPNVVDQFGSTPWSQVKNGMGDEIDCIQQLLLEHGVRTD
jgi:ankyrin repeat protein